MGRKKNKTVSSNIGRRTGTNVLPGKLIRRREDGIDMFDDYWTDSGSDQTTVSNCSIRNRSQGILENVSNQVIGAVSPMKPLRSSLKKAVNQSSGEYVGDSSPGFSKKKLLTFSEDIENVTNATKMTQTSYLLDETERSPSKNRMQLKGIRVNDNSLSDNVKNSPAKRSTRILSNNFEQNIMENMPSADVGNVALSHEVASRKQNKNRSNSGAEDSLSKNRTYTKISHLEETGGKSINSSLTETISPVQSSPRVLSNTLTQNKHTTEDTNAVLSYEVGSGKKIKNTSNSTVSEAEGSPSKNRTNAQMSYLKEIRRNEVSSSESEDNSQIRKSPRKLSSNLAQSLKEDLPLSTVDANVELSHILESVGKTKNKSNSRVGEGESSPSQKRIYSQISPVKKTGLKKIDSSRNERNSTVGRSSITLSNTFVQSSMKDLASSANVALGHKIASGKKTKNKSTSRVGEGEGSPSQKRTYSQISLVKKTGLKKIDSSRKERNSTVRRSSRSLSNTFVQSNMQDLASSTDGANVALPHKIASGKKTKNKSNLQVTGAEGSPPKNQTYTQITSLKETGLKTIDSSRCERNPLEKSSSILLHNLNTSIRKEKDNKRNSSSASSPQHSNRSSDVQNPKEESLKRLEIAASLERGSKRKKDLQKTSLGKSPIGGKRKLQVSKVLESSVSKSPRIQNKGDESNKGNTSGERSTQHAAKSSEVLNQEESIPSRSDKSIKRSEILVSSPKENLQRSTVEKSRRVSDHNMRKVSNSTDSHMTANKPVHSARRKIDFHETQTDTLKKNEPASYGVRRSSRNRFPCLASWRNERPKFKNSSSGEIQFLGIDKGQPEDDYAYKRLEKRMHLKKVQKPRASKRKGKNIRKTTISNVLNGKKIKLNLHRPFSTCEWVKPKNDENAGYMVSKVFSSGLLAFGFLDIDAHSMKDKQYSPTDNVYFIVVKGVVDVLIEETSFTFRSPDSFIVPIGSIYSIANNTSSSALLNFCSFKMPFFKYQDIV